MDFQTEVELAALVRERKCLWLSSHPSYCQRDIRERQLTKIAALLAGGLFTGEWNVSQE